MKKKFAAFFILATCSFLAHAHEFWLQPSKFIFIPGENAVINFKVGENFIGEPWKFTTHKLERLELHQQQGVLDVKDKVKEGPEDNLQVILKNEGTYTVALQSSLSFIEIEAEKFNAYLNEDGLDEAYAYREANNSLDKKGTEFYSRYTKLMLQAGRKTDDTFKKNLGLIVEIIPEQNPYNLKVGDPVKFKILFQGKPLFGAKVRVWNRHNNRTTVQNIYSQQDGMIETHISNPGAWMVSFVKMVPSEDPKAEWQSYWGSLVFGVK